MQPWQRFGFGAVALNAPKALYAVAKIHIDNAKPTCYTQGDFGDFPQGSGSHVIGRVRLATMGNERAAWIAWNPQRPMAWLCLVFGGSLVAVFLLLRLAPVLQPNLVVWAAATGYLLIVSYYVQRVRRRSLETVGVTERNWPQAMGLGLVLGLLMGGIAIFRSMLAGGQLSIPQLDWGLLAFAIPLALVVAGEEVFFRGWCQDCLEPSLGVLPAVLIAALAYAVWPIAFLLPGSAADSVQTPIGLVVLSGGDLLILFAVALFLNLAFRITSSLWASGLANFISRFALVFVASPTDFNAGTPLLVLVVSLSLWAVVLLYNRHWARAASLAGASRE